MVGGGMLAAFPLAYAVILPATYPLIISIPLGILFFRGVTFQYRWHDPKHRALSDTAYFGGPIVATDATIVLMGAVSRHHIFLDTEYAERWLTPREI